MIQRARCLWSSLLPSHTAVWPPLLACPSKSSSCAPCQTDSRLMSTSHLAHMPLRMQLISSLQTKREWQQLWRTLSCWRWSTSVCTVEPCDQKKPFKQDLW